MPKLSAVKTSTIAATDWATLSRLIIASLMLLIAASCSTSTPTETVAPNSEGLLNDPVLGVASSNNQCKIPAMMKLWGRRSQGSNQGYALGPGDELVISVPEVDEL